MKCPSCSTTELKKTPREGFDIDYCPNCKGMWLERGELDKIIQRLTRFDQSQEIIENGDNSKTINTEKKNHHSPIMDNIESSRELHQLHMSGHAKQHWMHRLFS